MSEVANNDTIKAEIGEIIKGMSEETAEQKVVTAAEDADGAAVASAKPEKAERDEFVADDALIERAVKAGLSVADAKSFANADQADRILKALEAKKETPKTEKETAPDDEGDGFPADGFDKLLDELENDKDEYGNSNYDPKVVGAMKQMSALLKKQANEIGALKKAGGSAFAQTAFDSGFDALDKGVRDHVDAATKSQLKAKYDFLKSAHAAADDGVSDAEVFEEARKLVLGEIESRYGAEDKAAAIERRRSLTLARPGGESGQRGQDRPMTEEDIAASLFKMMTK